MGYLTLWAEAHRHLGPGTKVHGMSKGNVGCIEKIYGFDWAAVGGREVGFKEMEEVVSPEFKSRFSAEVGGQEVEGLRGLREFGEALEQDFASFSYDALDFTEAGEDTVVVTGTIKGTSRSSKMPLSGEFGHVWKCVDGRAVSVEAYMDPDDARSAAGLSSSSS